MQTHKHHLVWLVLGIYSVVVTAERRHDSTKLDVSADEAINKVFLRSRRSLKDLINKINFIGVVGQLYTEQREEQEEAIRKITALVNNNFAPEPSSNSSTTSSTTASSADEGDSAGSSEGEGAPASSTPAPPFRATRNEVLVILRKNLLGLNNLLMREWRTAMEDSKKNSDAAIKEFRESVRPFLMKNSTMASG